jgi:hypothetical protein
MTIMWWVGAWVAGSLLLGLLLGAVLKHLRRQDEVWGKSADVEDNDGPPDADASGPADRTG